MSFDLGNSLHKPHSNENEALVPNFRDQLHESFFFVLSILLQCIPVQQSMLHIIFRTT